MATTSATWQNEYYRLEADYERLREEAEYAVRKRLDAQAIKLHSLTSRVKGLASLEEKAQRKNYVEPLEQAPDVVGIRVVVLFLPDLSTVAEIVASLFDVVKTSDTVEGSGDPATFGYMSQHYEVYLSAKHTGARYEGLGDIRFEVQVRTLLMDAWANVSQFLGYKDELSIPAELRRDFHALSGLFYVADKHFELFFDQTKLVREQTDQQLSEDSSDVPLNLDTLAAFLEQRFPNRQHGSRAGIGELVDELLRFGYKTIAELEEMLARSEQQFAKSEKEKPPHGQKGRKFFDVGVIRVSLGLLDPSYEKFVTDKAVSKKDASAPRRSRTPRAAKPKNA
jgi:ppGpp synthetase/RelA/SpoT-type nucleotidyltranferase